VRALRILVVVMGVMLVGGFVALIVSIAYMVKQQQSVAPASATAAAAPAPYTAAPIELPAGARIEMFSAGSDRLVLHVTLPDGNRELLVLDLASGRRLGTIPLRTAR
jgi:flagellar basal body-associated protein FliL